jgi:hypothetical protein
LLISFGKYDEAGITMIVPLQDLEENLGTFHEIFVVKKKHLTFGAIREPYAVWWLFFLT